MGKRRNTSVLYKKVKSPCFFRVWMKVVATGVVGYLLLITNPQSPLADVPQKTEQLIYSILAFNGKDYTHTFCREKAPTFYLIANRENFVNVKKTFVYYWPITGEWKTDLDTLNQSFTGYIEIKAVKGRLIKKIASVDYTYYNVPGKYENNWKVKTGEDAYRELEKWKGIYYSYLQTVENYGKEYKAYITKLQELVEIMHRLEEQKKDTREISKQISTLQPPSKPQPPEHYTVPPHTIDKAYILNLPPGVYNVRFILKDGTVLEGSEKMVVCFDSRRKDGIGFDIIPGDRWTRPTINEAQSSVIYVDGSTDLYLRSYFQNEYNDLYYKKMNKNDSLGNVHLFDWVRIQQVPDARISLTFGDGMRKIIDEEPFMVKQVKGPSLGYIIVPYTDSEEKPHLIAFHIPMKNCRGVIKIEVIEKGGYFLKGSKREIRIVRREGWRKTLWTISLLPLILMVVVLSSRRKKYSTLSS